MPICVWCYSSTSLPRSRSPWRTSEHRSRRCQISAIRDARIGEGKGQILLIQEVKQIELLAAASAFPGSRPVGPSRRGAASRLRRAGACHPSASAFAARAATSPVLGCCCARRPHAHARGHAPPPPPPAAPGARRTLQLPTRPNLQFSDSFGTDETDRPFLFTERWLKDLPFCRALP
jgi:hypothetical protein